LLVLVEIIRYGARDTLKPYCTIIIIALFESLSSIEPDLFNYASMKLTASEMKEQIDMARLLCARSSPMMDAIQTCTNQYVDDTLLDDLSSKLVDAIKHSIGLTTKCLLGQYFMTLTNLYPILCSKYVGKWMAVLVNTMNMNSNRTLRKTYTNVLGTIVRIAKRSSIENLLQKIATWYYQPDTDYQYVCALTLNSISQSNHDMLVDYGQQILPLIFLAMQNKRSTCDTDDEQQDEELIWTNLWIEHTGSSMAGIRMYMKGIVDHVRLAIEHSSYPMKVKGARAVQTIGETLKSTIQADDLFQLVELLLKGLYGRVYDGKVRLLFSCLSMDIVCRSLMS
jgi:proteasome component ECM29